MFKKTINFYAKKKMIKIRQIKFIFSDVKSCVSSDFIDLLNPF